MSGTGMLIVCPPELASGFRLAGVEVRPADSGDAAAVIVSELIEKGGAGVVGVYEPYVDDFDAGLRVRAEASLRPVVIAVPTGLEAEPEAGRRARLASMLRRAVGYHVTFGEGE